MKTVIIYDDEAMCFFEGYFLGMEIQHHTEMKRSLFGTVQAEVTGTSYDIRAEKVKKIKGLDEKTMKRIAKLNKEADIAELTEHIERQEKQLSEIKGKIERFHDKYREIINFIDNGFETPKCDCDDCDYE